MNKYKNNSLKEEEEDEGAKNTSIEVYTGDVDMENFIWIGKRKPKTYSLVTFSKTFRKIGALLQ